MGTSFQYRKRQYTVPAKGNVKMKRVCFCSKQVCWVWSLLSLTKGFSICDIHTRLEEEEIFVSKKTLHCLLKKYVQRTPTIGLQIYEGKRAVTLMMAIIIDHMHTWVW